MLKGVPRPLNSGASTPLSQRNIFSDQWADSLHSNQYAMSKCALGMKGATHNERSSSGCLEPWVTRGLAATSRIRVTAPATPARENERQVCVHCVFTVPYKKRYVWHPTDCSSDLRLAWRRSNSPRLALFKISFKQNTICTRLCDTGVKAGMLCIRRMCSMSPFHLYFISEDLT